MRVMMTIRPGMDKANRAAREGTLGTTMGRLIEQLRPEAAYFAPREGRRTAVFVFDLKEASQIPTIAEPLFAELDAEIDIVPVMTIDDLRTGLEGAARRR